MKEGDIEGQGGSEVGVEEQIRYRYVTAGMKKVATLYGADVHPAEV